MRREHSGNLRFLKRIVIGSLLTLGLTATAWPILYPMQPASAQSIGERIRRLFDTSRPEGSASGRANGGAVRDARCGSEEIATASDAPSSSGLRALVREDNYGTATSSHPVFYFFTSYTNDLGGSNEAGVAELALADESGYELYGDALLRVRLPEHPAIIRIEIPENMPPLQPRRSYKWNLTVLCDEQERSRNPFVEGWVERVNPDVPTEEPNWHEEVDELAKMRRERTDEWLAFLEIYGLEALIDTPVIDLPVIESEEEELPDFLQ
ncbi:MAG: DUF928 domain-containing protein [Elainellaceae cyanobacterium]